MEAELAVRTGTPRDHGRPHEKEKERQELTVLAVHTWSSERREEGCQRDQNRPPPGPQTSGLQEGGGLVLTFRPPVATRAGTEPSSPFALCPLNKSSLSTYSVPVTVLRLGDVRMPLQT